MYFIVSYCYDHGIPGSTQTSLGSIHFDSDQYFSHYELTDVILRTLNKETHYLPPHTITKIVVLSLSELSKGVFEAYKSKMATGLITNGTVEEKF